MGKVSHQPNITHFSHPHELELCNLNLPENNQTTRYPCSACCLPQSSTGYIYICKSCPNFSLHLPCSQMPTAITHPSHPQHSLSLSHSPTYLSGIFTCDACNLNSTGFNYHCSTCNFDLDIKCANKPLILNHNLHPHPLDLTFAHPYGDGNGFSCDVCGQLGTSEWLYRCASCGFDVHLDCPPAPAGVAVEVRPQILRHTACEAVGVMQGQQPQGKSFQAPELGAQHSGQMNDSPSMGNTVVRGVVGGGVQGVVGWLVRMVLEH